MLKRALPFCSSLGPAHNPHTLSSHINQRISTAAAESAGAHLPPGGSPSAGPMAAAFWQEINTKCVRVCVCQEGWGVEGREGRGSGGWGVF